MGGRLAGKAAFVTGAASGLGQAIAMRFAEEGGRVALADRDTEGGERVAAAIGAAALFLRLDVTQEAQWQAQLGHAAAAFGRLDILVNNAGIGPLGSIEKTTLEEWRGVHAVNLDGVFLGCKHGIPHLRAAGGGSIVNLSSSAGMVGGAKTIGYTASKWAVRGMTKAAAVELGPRHIRVNSVHPHVILTPMAAASNAEALGAPPVGRFGQPDDAAMLIVFLASDESGYITGSEHVLDGGALAGWR